MNSNCVRCLSPAELFCSRCEDSYCSSECQLADWSGHRFICIKMPALKFSNGLRCSPNISGETVNVSRISSNDAKTIPTKTKVEASKNGVEVVKKPEAELPMKQVEAKKVEPELPKKEVEVKKVEVETFVQNKPRETPQAKLEISSTNALKLNSMGIRSMRPKPVETAEPVTPKVVMISDLIKREWNLSGKLKVNFVGFVDETDPSYMVLCDEKFQDEFDKAVAKVQTYCKNLKKGGYVPKLSEVVLSKFSADDNWYRAVVLDKKDGQDMFLVQYIDYGNFDNVGADNILALPQELKQDIISKTFKIFNCPESVDDLNDKQTDILASGSFHIHQIKSKNDQQGCEIFGF